MWVVVVTSGFLLPLVDSCKGTSELAAFLGAAGSFRDGRTFGGVGSVRKNGVECGRRLAAIQEEEWGEVRGRLWCGVVGVRHERQNKVPISVIRGDVLGEHVAKGAVKPFRQTVSLRMVGGGGAVNDTTFSKERVDDFGEEHTSSIAQEFSRCAVTENKVFQEEGCYVTGCGCR